MNPFVAQTSLEVRWMYYNTVASSEHTELRQTSSSAQIGCTESLLGYVGRVHWVLDSP